MCAMKVSFSFPYSRCWACSVTTNEGAYVRFMSWKRGGDCIRETAEIWTKNPENLNRALARLEHYPAASSFSIMSRSEKENSAVVRVTIPANRCPLYEILDSFSSRSSAPVEERVDTDGRVHWVIQVANMRKARLAAARIRELTRTNSLRMRVLRGRIPSREGVYILKRALEEGYFDVPRRISSRELAAKLDLPFSTLNAKLRRSLRTILYDTIR